MSPLFRLSFCILCAFLVAACADQNRSSSADGGEASTRPTIGYVQIVEDATLDQAREGFFAALAEAGYSEEKGNIEVVYRNAQGDNAALTQILDYFIGQEVDLIATNPTVAMIAAVGRTKTIPVFMMVGPSPELAKVAVADASGRQLPPANLFGAYETLDYIDTSVATIRTLLPDAKRVGTIYNSAEPNSTNALERLRAGCQAAGLELEEVAVTATSEAQQAIESLLGRDIDLFFALPDNVIFGSFETVARACEEAKVPVVTSETGLVARGAYAGFGADFRAWGHQAGEAAARFLRSGTTSPDMLQKVGERRRTYNPATARRLGLQPPAGFDSVAGAN